MEEEFTRAYSRLRSQHATGNDGYYQITFLADETGRLVHAAQSQWCGFTETRPRREVRSGRLFHPDPQKKFMEELLGESCVVVNDSMDLQLFFLWGGHALIEKTVGDKYLSDFLGPRECLRDSSHSGFVDAELLPSNKTNRAPSKKLRMKIIERDDYRCRVCGRSPANYVDIELHVHHIIPWGIGGITERQNLITLCNTCHGGLDPHYSPNLSRVQVGIKNTLPATSSEYYTGVKNYQLAVSKHILEAGR